MRELTKKEYNVLKGVAKKFSIQNRVNTDDLLSYLHEKIIAVIKRFDESRGVPFCAYLAHNANFLCLNFLRDDANLIQIGRRENYIPIAEQALLKRQPGLVSADPATIASNLGCSLNEYLQAKRDTKMKYTTSLDEKPYEEYNISGRSPELYDYASQEEIDYVKTIPESEQTALLRFSEGKPIGKRTVAKVRDHIQNLITIRETG